MLIYGSHCQAAQAKDVISKLVGQDWGRDLRVEARAGGFLKKLGERESLPKVAAHIRCVPREIEREAANDVRYSPPISPIFYHIW